MHDVLKKDHWHCGCPNSCKVKATKTPSPGSSRTVSRALRVKSNYDWSNQTMQGNVLLKFCASERTLTTIILHLPLSHLHPRTTAAGQRVIQILCIGVNTHHDCMLHLPPPRLHCNHPELEPCDAKRRRPVSAQLRPRAWKYASARFASEMPMDFLML